MDIIPSTPYYRQRRKIRGKHKNRTKGAHGSNPKHLFLRRLRSK